ncbi:hypothetical protein LXL04_016099 [Taraxacum kok-saghyz]
MYLNVNQPLPLACVDSFLRKVYFKSYVDVGVDDDIHCGDDVQMITQNLKKQPTRLREFIDPTKTSVNEPVVHKTTRGRPVNVFDQFHLQFKNTLLLRLGSSMLEREYPLPPIAPQWTHCKRPCAAEWVTPYIERLNMLTRETEHITQLNPLKLEGWQVNGLTGWQVRNLNSTHGLVDWVRNGLRVGGLIATPRLSHLNYWLLHLQISPITKIISTNLTRYQSGETIFTTKTTKTKNQTEKSASRFKSLFKLQKNKVVMFTVVY